MNIFLLKELSSLTPLPSVNSPGWKGTAGLLTEAQFTARLPPGPKTALISVKFPQTQWERGTRFLTLIHTCEKGGLHGLQQKQKPYALLPQTAVSFLHRFK